MVIVILFLNNRRLKTNISAININIYIPLIYYINKCKLNHKEIITTFLQGELQSIRHIRQLKPLKQAKETHE